MFFMSFSVSFLIFAVVSALEDITAEPGQNVTLPGRAPSSSEITTVEWTRPDLDPVYVIVYQTNQPDPDNQHPSFKERVELKDSQMKDGDVSVTLKNVTFTDTGTYKCRVFQSQTKAPELISTVHLRVSAGQPHFLSLVFVSHINNDLPESFSLWTNDLRHSYTFGDGLVVIDSGLQPMEVTSLLPPAGRNIMSV